MNKRLVTTIGSLILIGLLVITSSTKAQTSACRVLFDQSRGVSDQPNDYVTDIFVASAGFVQLTDAYSAGGYANHSPSWTDEGNIAYVHERFGFNEYRILDPNTGEDVPGYYGVFSTGEIWSPMYVHGMEMYILDVWTLPLLFIRTDDNHVFYTQHSATGYRLSDDGTQILYWGRDGFSGGSQVVESNIYLLDIQTETESYVAQGADASWINSEAIVFSRRSDSTYSDIWMLDMETYVERPLVQTNAIEWTGKASGEWLTYTADGEIHILNLRTSEATALGIMGRSPVWSPDGTQIAFITDGYSNQIGILDMESGEWQQVTNFSGYSLINSISWDPSCQ